MKRNLRAALFLILVALLTTLSSAKLAPDKVVEQAEIKLFSSQANKPLPIQPSILSVGKLKARSLKKIHKKAEENNSGVSTLTTLGILFLLVGAGIFIYMIARIYVPIFGMTLSIIGGFVLFLALIIIIVGAIEKSNQSYRDKSETAVSSPNNQPIVAPAVQMQDVVYLKNGSVIKGTILEQKLGEYIKIDSSVGVFTYQMNEIEKITKEKAGK